MERSANPTTTSASTTSASTEQTTTAVVGSASDFAVGDMKLARVGDHRIAVIRTPSGMHAIDNACPHQGYGLVTGSLDGEIVTCQWHNWKFRVSDGQCIIGEEDVACHQIDVDTNGAITVTVTEPTPDEQRAALWPSLDRGFDNDYRGQMARDTARLLRAGATPAQIVARGVTRSQHREPWGVGHGLAMATDCLALADAAVGDDAALPVVQALTAMSEPTRFRPEVKLAAPNAAADLAEAIECEDVDAAVAATRAHLVAGDAPAVLLDAYVRSVGRHHLSYGHGAIYVQKAFEMLDRIGWEHADDVLPHLTLALAYGTREDTLPYMTKAMRRIDSTDPQLLADREIDPKWKGAEALAHDFLAATEAPIDAAVEALDDGAGVPGVLDAVTLAVSERMLRFDLAVEFDPHDGFGWLDITHGITYANAARWIWHRQPSAAAARLALFTVFLAHDTGRAERTRTGFEPAPIPAPVAGDLVAAVLDRRPDDAVAHALAAEQITVAEALATTSLLDRSGSWIVTAHIVKLAVAAAVEAAATGSSRPLAAAARFAAAPRLERFVAAEVASALEFVRTGSPPRR